MPRQASTEVVYRLYETVDELTTVIENARSVPMSGSCMVPRDHLLDLLDDLRESLPEDVRAAGAIVEQRTEILQQAQAEAERLTGRTRGEADQLIANARRQRDQMLARAQAEADQLLAEAEAEAEQLIAEGRRQQAQLLAAARAEHERLITETEVYRGAVARADELGAQTATDVARMRAEVDEYVDTRLAEFGSTLERMLRSVEAARSTLREP
jgi:cell division septum initiation protein DivIVA